MRHTRPKKSRGLKTLSIKVPRSVSARVAWLARERHTTVSAIVRDAIERYDASVKGSFAEVAAEFIGCLKGGPGDLATNPARMKGYGS